MDALPLLTPSVGSGEDESSTTFLTQEAAQKVLLLESERDSLKAERHMYQMKWLTTEDMLEAVKNGRQSLEVPIQLCKHLNWVVVTTQYKMIEAKQRSVDACLFLCVCNVCVYVFN